MADSTASIKVRLGFIFDQKSLAAVEKSLQRTGDRLARTGQNISLFISAPLAAIGVSAIKAAGEFESLSLSMQATFKNAGRTVAEANAEVEALRKAALAPGLDFPQAVAASIRLQSVGLSAEKARDTIQELANAVASTGGTAIQLESVTVQMAQMISKGKVLSGDLRIIQENLPIISDLMLKAFGTSNAEKIQELGITGKEFVSKITVEMGKLTRVSGGISNAIVNAGSAVNQALAGIGEEIARVFDIKGLSESFSSALHSMTEGFKGLSDTTKKVIVYVSAFLVALGPIALAMSGVASVASMVVGAWGSLVGAANALKVALFGVDAAIGRVKLALGIVGLVVGLAVAVYSLSENFDAAEFAASKFADAQKEIIAQTSSEIGALNQSFAALKDETKSRVEKGKVVDALLKQYPEYLKGIDLETASVSKLTEIQKGLNSEILRGVAERQKAAAVNSIYEEQAKILTRIAQIRRGDKVTASEGGLIDTGDLYAAGNIAAAVIKKMEEQAAALGNQVNIVAKDFDAAFGTMAAAVDPALQAEYALRDAYYASKDAVVVNTAASKKGTATKVEQASAVKATTKAHDDEIKVLENYAKMIAEIEQAWKDEAVAAAAAIKIILDANPNFEPLPVGPSPDAPPAVLPTISDDAIKAMEEERKAHEKLMEDFKQARIDAAVSIANSVGSVFAAFSDKQTEKELANINAEGAARLAAANGNAALEASIRADLDAKRAAVEQKAAKRQKRLALAEAIINTAVAITKAIGSAPPPFNVPAIIAASVAGAAQVAIIAAHAKGTKDAPGGLSLVGERGPELINLPRHSQVFPAHVSESMMKGGGVGGIHLSGEFVVRGTDLVLTLDRVQQKQNRYQ